MRAASSRIYAVGFDLQYCQRSPFAQKEIQMFTEYGRTDAQERFKQFLSKDYANDTILEKELAHFNVYNSATWVLWINTNWFDFLKKYYYLQKEKNLKLWFTDGRTLGIKSIRPKIIVVLRIIIETV